MTSNPARGGGVGIHGEAVVLGGDLDPAGVEVLHRVVGAVVPEGQLERPRAERQRQDLLAEADPERRQPRVDQPAHGLDQVGHALRVARAVGQEEPVRARAASTSSAEVKAGTTVTRQPSAVSWRRMFRLIPES